MLELSKLSTVLSGYASSPMHGTGEIIEGAARLLAAHSNGSVLESRRWPKTLLFLNLCK